MIAALLLLPFLQEKIPAEDHAWLRFKAGTWVRNVITVKDVGFSGQGIQTLTLKERDGDKYSIEEDSTLSLGGPSLHRTALPAKTGTGSVTVDGKPIACTIWTAKGERDGRPTETSYWIPDGRKDPVRMTFKQTGMEGDVKAVSLKESIKIDERTFTCVKLEGKITTVRGTGTMTLWTSLEIPGAQVRLDIALNTPDGKVTFNVEPLEIHEEK
jgi:hypothetical protein